LSILDKIVIRKLCDPSVKNTQFYYIIKAIFSQFYQIFIDKDVKNEWDYKYWGNVLDGLKMFLNNFNESRSWFGEVREVLIFWNFLKVGVFNWKNVNFLTLVSQRVLILDP